MFGAKGWGLGWGKDSLHLHQPQKEIITHTHYHYMPNSNKRMIYFADVLAEEWAPSPGVRHIVIGTNYWGCLALWFCWEDWMIFFFKYFVLFFVPTFTVFADSWLALGTCLIDKYRWLKGVWGASPEQAVSLCMHMKHETC